MKAIVCDCCGKVILVEDKFYCYDKIEGVHHLVGRSFDNTELDLCQECADKLMAAVRNE